ncbi:MAG: hypothetical protein KC731_38070 [Myxococcales bacterium]|nr:hypothetical protein [Myxococcales bacterium]
MKRRQILIASVLASGLGAVALWQWARFPPDTTPPGAYMRIARAIADDAPENAFAYLEEEAQHACFTIAGYGREAVAVIDESYPEPDKSEALARYRPYAAPDGPTLFARFVRDRGFGARLRRDLSGIAETEIAGERATIVTVHGTRYAFRLRPNGIWGLTMFTAELLAEQDKLARDLPLIERAAQDYRRGGAETPVSPKPAGSLAP